MIKTGREIDLLRNTNPETYIAQVYDAFVTRGKLIVDYRIDIETHDGKFLFRIGSFYNLLTNKYIDVPPELYCLPARKWILNPPQVRLFALLSDLLDREKEHPIQEIYCRGGRRSGKTEGAVLLGLAFSVMYAGANIGVFSLDHKSGKNMLEKIQHLGCPDWFERYDMINHCLYMSNGSQIHFFSQKNYRKAGRSYSFDFLLLDEAPYYENLPFLLESVRGSIIQHDGCLCAIYSPPPWFDSCYHQETKAANPDPAVSEPIKVVEFGSTLENVFLSDKAKRKVVDAARNMTKDEYTREIKGQYSKTDGLVLYDFSRAVHVVQSVPAYLIDITTDFSEKMWGKKGVDWVIGMDFNENPLVACCQKIYWDPFGGTLVTHDELIDFNSNTEKFIRNKLLPWLKSMYPQMKDDKELARKVVIVADASSWWQGTGKNNTKDALVVPAQKFLQAYGFYSMPPKAIVRNSNAKSVNKQMLGRNPSRGERMETTRTRLLDQFQQPHLYILSHCENLIKVCESLELYQGLPDLRSEHVHQYDAWTYPIYRLYPRVQLHKLDDSNLSGTYYTVAKIGETLDQVAKGKHPYEQLRQQMAEQAKVA